MSISRRDILFAGSASLLGSTSNRRPSKQNDKETSGAAKPALQVAHVTDIHLFEQRNAPEGMSQMLRHMFGQDEWKPDVLFNTGDSLMAVDGETTGARAVEQIEIWNETIKGCPVDLISCLGNHDVWNGRQPVNDTQAKKKGFKLMTEVLKMPAPYFAVENGGWLILSLNSMCSWPSYAMLNEEHFRWLENTLAKNALPVVVLSHVPILSVTSQVYGDSTRKENNNLIPGTWHHADCWRITEVFRRHPEVKLCLSGHMHTQDHVRYRNVDYICGGAVSGAWWNGSEYGFPPCYGKLDLYADGTFNYEFIDYGWTARQWRGKQLKPKR